MTGWAPGAGFTLPAWRGYRRLLASFRGAGVPGCDQLNDRLAGSIRTRSGQPLAFVAADSLHDDLGYEQRIWQTGQVSTRTASWHDFFNALAWARWPAVKAAINQLHVQTMAGAGTDGRGPLRDALTLFDECGVVVVSREPGLLEALARHQWQTAFVDHAAVWDSSTCALLAGHAMLEKLLKPYRSMTANALLVQVDDQTLHEVQTGDWQRLDERLAGRLLNGQLLTSPADLSPLPLAGIPGGWQDTPQDADFYADRSIFRPLRAGYNPAPVTQLG